MERYRVKMAAAWVRGQAMETGVPQLPVGFLNKALDDLTERELNFILRQGEVAGLKLYHFKADKELLPRVRRVLGFLRGIEFRDLMDVGSGRGVFLLPFLEAFPGVPVFSVEQQSKWVKFMQALGLGGFDQLTATCVDYCQNPFCENIADVVTMLEVLEHMPQPELAVAAAVKNARKYVIVSVPSKEDDNPEHIHLLTKEKLTRMFHEAGCTRLHFDGVNGHLILFAAVAQ